MICGTQQGPSHSFPKPPYLSRHQHHRDEYLTYISPQEAQFPWSWDLRPRLSGVGVWEDLQFILASLIKLVSSVGLVPWDHHTWFSIYTLLLPSASNVFVSVPTPSEYCLFIPMLVSLPRTTFTNQWTRPPVCLSIRPSHQKCVVFNPIMLGIGLLLFRTGTRLGATTLGMQQLNIKANTNLSAILTEHIGLLHRSLVLMQQLHDSLAQIVWDNH